MFLVIGNGSMMVVHHYFVFDSKFEKEGSSCHLHKGFVLFLWRVATHCFMEVSF